MTAALGQLARDPDVLITKIGPARYVRFDGSEPSIMPLIPRMEEVRAQVLEVLAAATGPMRPAQVWTVLEAQPGESFSYDTVAGFLSLAARHPDVPVKRVKQGWYAGLEWDMSLGASGCTALDVWVLADTADRRTIATIFDASTVIALAGVGRSVDRLAGECLPAEPLAKACSQAPSRAISAW